MVKAARKAFAWVQNILVAIDQLANAMLGGDPDETLSSRLGKNRARCPLCYWICRALHLIDPGHCDKSIEQDEGERTVIR